jgi:hypothetical protein
MPSTRGWHGWAGAPTHSPWWAAMEQAVHVSCSSCRPAAVQQPLDLVPWGGHCINGAQRAPTVLRGGNRPSKARAAAAALSCVCVCHLTMTAIPFAFIQVKAESMQETIANQAACRVMHLRCKRPWPTWT